jgi:dTDP-4-dehydrorhamnose reductase
VPHKRILVLGSASWLGSSLINKLGNTKFDITSTYFNTLLNFDSKVNLINAISLNNHKQLLESSEFHVIINFLRGENEEGYHIHKEIINYCKSYTDCHYIYCSSALALDAYENQSLTEYKTAKAKSDYGVFKANCEKMLYDSGIDWTVLRFASLQGYCKHKIVRNENFLNQLKEGKTIKVDKHVFQNRMYVEDAIDLIIKIIEIKQTGIIHLGTIDSSDEIDFLKKQARLFGFNSNLIQYSGNSRNVNLNCIPKKIHLLSEKSIKFTEDDTLNKVFSISEFNKYKNTVEN